MNSYWVLFVLWSIFESYNVLCGTVRKNKCVYLEYGENSGHIISRTCMNITACKKRFKISVIDIPPYSDNIKRYFRSMLWTCCGNCRNDPIINKFKNISEITPAVMESSDIILPFLGPTSQETLHGNYFIPFGFVPNGIFVTPRYKPLVVLMDKIVNLIPLIIMCVLLSGVAGFIVWIIETTGNKDDFPRPFKDGWFRGFWWSFTTMITVGYGDQTPRTGPGRIVSIIWILIGITMFGILTGSLTNEIIEVNNPPPPDMANTNVGVLKYRGYDDAHVSMLGGIIVKSPHTRNFEEDALALIFKLKEKQVAGIFLDKHTLSYGVELLETAAKRTNRRKYQESLDYFLYNTRLSEKVYPGEKLSYGMLFKDVEDYNFFHEVDVSNRIYYETALRIYLNKKFQKFKQHNIYIFHVESPYFITSVIYIFVIFVVIIIFGVLYELIRRKILRCKKCCLGSVVENDINELQPLRGETNVNVDELRAPTGETKVNIGELRAPKDETNVNVETC